MDLQINILELIQIVISLILGVFTIIQFFYFIKEVKQNSRNIITSKNNGKDYFGKIFLEF